MICPAEPADAEAIIRLMKSEPGFWQCHWPIDVVERTLSSSSCVAFVYRADGKIVAFACAHDLTFRAYLSELIVSPFCRGRGIGSQLLSAVECALRSRGCPLVIADVWRDAEGFYRLHDWEPPAAVLLRKTLASP
ncbi:MAG: GNAT family N-acetyltransferase [Planctomycetaceae bacterium]|nr:GNAT family N-acetyltransferase [Planctomycetaceae bacterium]